MSRGHLCSTVGQGAGAEPILLPPITPAGQELHTDPSKLQAPKGLLQAALGILSLVCGWALASLPTGRILMERGQRDLQDKEPLAHNPWDSRGSPHKHLQRNSARLSHHLHLLCTPRGH